MEALIEYHFKAVEEVLGVTMEDIILNKSRAGISKHDIVKAKVLITASLGEIAYGSTSKRVLGYCDIAKILGGLDSTTVSYYKKTHSDLMFSSEKFRQLSKKFNDIIKVHKALNQEFKNNIDISLTKLSRYIDGLNNPIEEKPLRNYTDQEITNVLENRKNGNQII